MTGIVKTDQLQGAQGTTVTVPTGHTLAVTNNATVGGTLGVTGNATAGGTLGVTGNTTVGGTLVNTGLITASAGVAIGGTGSANTLDDYEEGTFSPVFHCGGGINGLTHDYSLGTYTKIGNRVILNGFASLSGKDGASIIGGVITIAGLPFTISNNNNAYSAAAIRIQNISFADQCSLATVVNSTRLEFREITNGGSVTQLNDGNIFGNSYVNFDIAYVVA